MDERQMQFRLEQDIKYFTPKLTNYQHKNGLIDSQLGKLERLKRPLITKITLMRAISHSTDSDLSPEADDYRAFVLKEALDAYNKYQAMEQEEHEYIKRVHEVNHNFVEEIAADYAPK